MINAIKKTSCVLAVLAATSTAVMAESIDVKVIGTITPTACKPTLGGGGTIDYGNIAPASLSNTTFTVLGEKQVDFSITCDAPAKVAIHAVGSKADTATDVIKSTAGDYDIFAGTLFGTPALGVAGLGASDGKNIGGYGIRLVPGTYTVDGNNADTITRSAITGVWVPSANLGAGSLFSTIYKELQISWAPKGTLTPMAFTTVAGKLGVQAYITKTSELDLSKPINLDGLTSLELVYL
ncbi:DUF1120 domain-containing protein [Serratia marcescens]|uniref:DUF1120 domain-containing protein n=1 Tax=Serratia marcescens TaxID=615 RepID=UPI003FA75F23|nr:DUF1120 domain-containing protein [Serratia marcescens]